MSQENVETARPLLAVFNRREKDAWLAAADPELEIVPERVARDRTSPRSRSRLGIPR